jgi:hypothetical protein
MWILLHFFLCFFFFVTTDDDSPSLGRTTQSPLPGEAHFVGDGETRCRHHAGALVQVWV